MAKLHYSVTVEFDTDAADPEKAQAILDTIGHVGVVTKVRANAVKTKATPSN